MLVAWCSVALAGAATFTASLDRDAVTLGESVVLSLVFEGGEPAEPILPPSVPNLQITSSGSSRQMQMINGRTSTSITYNYLIAARQPGEYAIPSLTAVVGAERLTTPPLTLKVAKPGAPSQEAISSGSQPAFAKLVLPKQSVYVGETIIAQIQFHVSARLQGGSQLQPTGFPAEGFSVGNMVEIEGQRHRTQIGSTVYNIIPVSVPLKALRAGTLTVGPVTFNLHISLRDPRDMFGIFGQTRSQTLPIATEPVTLESLPLPKDNVPPSFNGAIGNFNLSASAGPTNVAAGDPITVRVQINGRGNLETITLPDHGAWRDFKTYPPTSKVETTDQFGLTGVKVFEQVVTPQTADIKALPALVFSFFDPDQKAYRTVTQPPIPITVRPGGALPTPTVLARRSGQDNPPPTQDIVPNKQRPGMLGQLAPPLVERGWFLALQGVPVLVLVTGWVWRRRRETLAQNPRLRRQRQVAQLMREGLADLRRLAAENRSEEFFATLFRLLQEQLGERLDLPASAITEAVIEERLRPRGVPEAVLAPLQDLFQTCNQARYAPVKSSQELAAIVPRVEQGVQSLQGLKL
jgi:hypothetical protein